MCLFWSSSCVLGPIAGLPEPRRLAAGQQRTSQAALAPYKVADKVWGGRGLYWPSLSLVGLLRMAHLANEMDGRNNSGVNHEPPAPTNSLFSKPASPIADKQCCQRTALVSGVCRHPPPTPGWLLKPCLSSSFKAYQLSFLGVRWRQRGWEAGPLCGVDQPRVVDPATLPPAPFHVSSQDEPRLMSVGLLGVWRFIRCSSVLCERVAGFATETIRCRMQPRRALLRWLARLGLQSSCPAIARSSSDGCHLIGKLEWLLYQ